METIRGTITKFVYTHATTGWKIGRFAPADGTAEFSIKGEIPSSNLEHEVEIIGEFKENGKFGRDFEVTNCIRRAPSTRSSFLTWLMSSSNVKGIGPTTAKKILDEFGNDFRNVIENNHEELAKIRGISKATALNLHNAWINDSNEREVSLLLAGAGLSDKLARRVINTPGFGLNAVQVIEDNPYRLVKVAGIGFKTADKMALGMEWSVQRPERLDAALGYLLKEAFNDGHSFLFRHELITQVCVLAEMDNGGKMEPLSEEDAVTAINRCLASGDIVEDSVTTNGHRHVMYYLPHIHELEMEAAELIARMQSTPHIINPNLRSLLTKVEKELNLQLSDNQQDAVVSSLANNVSIITGLPGTGKTSTVRALVNVARGLGLHVQLAAPTGRAAKRLTEVTELPALTLHRLLQYNPEGGGFLFNEDNPLECNLLILDESSMIDLEMMVHVLRAIPSDCSLVLVGDVNQLPSVGAGMVLRDFINSRRLHTTVLDKIFRQAEGSLIIQNAHRIHRGDMPQFPPKGSDGDSFWIKVPRAVSEDTGKPTDDIDFVKNNLKKIYERLQAKFGYDPIKDIQVLTPMRIGPAGYNVFNTVIQELVNPDGERMEINGSTFRVGDRVMQTKNDYKLEVYNGDVGFIREVDVESKSILIEWSDRSMLYPFEQIENLSLSYAVSVHKSQGSEFPAVILLLTGHHHPMLDRNMVYTAGTRARKLCVWLASHHAVEKAVRTQNVMKRNSLLALRVKKAVDITQPTLLKKAA